MAVGCGEQGVPRTSGPAGPGSPQGDDEVLAAVRTELVAAVALVATTRERHRSLRRPLADLEAAHTTQLRVLDPDSETAAPPAGDVPRDPDLALARLRTSEERLQRRLLTWAVAVDSGPLARVLAAASAGTAQHLATLPGGVVA